MALLCLISSSLHNRVNSKLNILKQMFHLLLVTFGRSQNSQSRLSIFLFPLLQRFDRCLWLCLGQLSITFVVRWSLQYFDGGLWWHILCPHAIIVVHQQKRLTILHWIIRNSFIHFRSGTLFQ